MPVFAYKASDSTSAWHSGTIVADTARTARDTLRARGLRVEEISTGKSAQSKSLFYRRPGKRYGAKTIGFIRELATLLGVGIPLLEAIDTIARQYSGPFHNTLLQLRDRIASGISLAEAMREQPEVFDEFCINITEVGENAGTLETVLDRLAEFKERSLALKDRVTTALLYPCIVLVMALGVSVFLMTFVVPKLLDGMIQAGHRIPLITLIVKGISDFLLHQWWLLLLILAALFTAATLFYRDPRGRMLWHRWQLRIPVAGDMIRKQAIMRIAVIVSTLMRSGIVFVRSVQIAQKSTRNLVLRQALERCEIAVNGGQDIAEAIEETGAFPPMVVQIFAVGQQSGRLEEMLERLASDYDRQLTTASQRLTAILEPVLILFLVFIVGFIAVATILPMLEAANVF
jgi:general secretion pathway protein F